MTRSISLVVAAAIATALSGCGDNFEAPGPDALVLDPATASLEVGESAQISAAFHRRGAVVIGGSVGWLSSDPSHVTVTGTGGSVTITAVAAGSATITATGEGLTAQLAVTVSPATLAGIAIAPPTPSLPAGTSRTMTVIATYSDRSTADITGSVTWRTEQPAIARIAGNVLTGVAPGDTTITASFQDKLSSTHVFVTDAVVQSIDVTPATPAVVVGLTQQFTATGHFTDATTKDLTASVVWASSMPGLAMISNAAGSQGLAIGVAPGMTTISATSGGVTGMTTLTVDASTLVSIAVTPGAPDLAVTADQQFTAIGTFSDHSILDITPTVTWSSSDPAVAAIGADGLASALAIGPTTITAQRGAITGSTVASVFLPAVGPWIAAPGFSGTPCHDAVKFSMASDLVYVCTTGGGMIRGSVAADTSISFAPVDLGPGASLAGLAIAAHTQNPTAVMFMTAPSGTAANWFRSNDGVTFAPFALLDSAGNGRFLYAGRFQMGLGNILGSWDPGTAGTPQAVVLTGGNPPTAVHPVASATGTVRAIAGSAGTNLYVAVLGETPTGAPATGGVFHSTSSGATWTETDTGIPAADRDQVFTVVMDPANPMNLYAGVRGGGRIYRTGDGGTSWTASATGIPARARLSVLLVSPTDSTTLFAATDRGLYRSTDAGASWTLAGFQARAVRGVAQSGAAASLILVAVDDAVGLYRAP
jgi:hypothetical protein